MGNYAANQDPNTGGLSVQAIIQLKRSGDADVVSTSNETLSGLPTIDTITLTDAQVALLTAQTNQVENGPWEVHVGAWTRPAWFPNGSTAASEASYVQQGAAKGGSLWFCGNVSGSDVVGTDNLTYAQASGPGATMSPIVLTASSDSETPLTLKQNSGSQSASMFKVTDNAGTATLFEIDADGSLLIKSGAGAHLTVNDGSNDVAVLSATGSLTLAPTISTTGSPSLLTVTGPAHTTLTASTEATDVNFNLARTVQFATGALTTQRAVRIQAPTYAFAGASTITTASTVEISGPPIAGTNATITNAYALRIASGNITSPGGQTSAEVFGAGASATAANATVFGNSATAGQWGNAFGYNAHATGTGAVSIGYGNATGSSGNYAIGIGHLTTANGNNCIVMGEQATAGSYATTFVVGRMANATAANQIVFGDVQGPYTAMYIGEGVTSTSPGAILISATGGSGSGVAGSTMTIAGGAAGTGDADGGGITLSPAAASGAGTKGVLTLDYAAFPATDAAGYLKSNGSGTLSWDSSAVDIGDAISGSSANRILYMNGSNVLANSSAFTFDGTDVVLTGASRNFSAPGTQTDSEKFGVGAATGGAKATAFGKNTSAYKDSAVFGYGAGGSSNNITAIGVLATCSGAAGGIALGYSTTAGNKALALGYDISAGTDSMKMAWGSATWVNGDSAGKVTFGGAVTATGAFIASSTVQFADVAYTFPNDAAGYLKSDGAGTLSWDSSAVDIGDAISGATNYRVLHIGGSGQLAGTAGFTMTSGVLALPGNLQLNNNELIMNVPVSGIHAIYMKQYIVGGVTDQPIFKIGADYITQTNKTLNYRPGHGRLTVGSGEYEAGIGYAISTSPLDGKIAATSAKGSNVAGADLTLEGGIGTGTGNGGNVVIKVAVPGGAGSTLNSLATALTISGVDKTVTVSNAFVASGTVKFADTAYTFPNDAAGYLKSNGSGTLSWDSSAVDIGDAISGATANMVLYTDGSGNLAQTTSTYTVQIVSGKLYGEHTGYTKTTVYGAGAAVGTGGSFGNDGTSIGYNARCASSAGTAIGSSAYCNNTTSVAVGNNSTGGHFGVSVGSATITLKNGVAIGNSATNTGEKGTCLGGSTSAGTDGTALGYAATAGNNALAIRWGGSEFIQGDSAGKVTFSGAVTATGAFTASSTVTTTVGGLGMDASGNTTLGLGQLADAATDGFSYMPTTTSGAPSGVPTAKTGYCPFVYDDTNDTLYVYNGGWKGVTLS